MGGEEIFAKLSSENFIQPVILADTDGYYSGLFIASWAPCQAEPSLLTIFPRNSFFFFFSIYIVHAYETPQEASGSVLITLVPIHFHPRHISSPNSYRRLSKDGWDSYGRTVDWLIITRRCRFIYRSSRHIAEQQIIFSWHGFHFVNWNACISNHRLLICISGIKGSGRGKQIYTYLNKKLPQGLPSSLCSPATGTFSLPFSCNFIFIDFIINHMFQWSAIFQIQW